MRTLARRRERLQKDFLISTAEYVQYLPLSIKLFAKAGMDRSNLYEGSLVDRRHYVSVPIDYKLAPLREVFGGTFKVNVLISLGIDWIN